MEAQKTHSHNTLASAQKEQFVQTGHAIDHRLIRSIMLFALLSRETSRGLPGSNTPQPQSDAAKPLDAVTSSCDSFSLSSKFGDWCDVRLP
jgi:hypothetical protein